MGVGDGDSDVAGILRCDVCSSVLVVVPRQLITPCRLTRRPSFQAAPPFIQLVRHAPAGLTHECTAQPHSTIFSGAMRSTAKLLLLLFEKGHNGRLELRQFFLMPLLILSRPARRPAGCVLIRRSFHREPNGRAPLDSRRRVGASPAASARVAAAEPPFVKRPPAIV